MKEKRRHTGNELPTDYVDILYRRHFQGALVRSGASVVMWVLGVGGGRKWRLYLQLAEGR